MTLKTPILGKAEYANPGGSVKDRIGLAIIEDFTLPDKMSQERELASDTSSLAARL